MKIDYSLIPRDTISDLEAYIERGRPLGGFMEAVVSNDLMQACGRADEYHATILFQIVAWLVNKAPAGVWGSSAAYLRHIDSFRRQRHRGDAA